MAMDKTSLILVANPGSSSRRYAIYDDLQLRGRLHFEYENDRVICRLEKGIETVKVPVKIGSIEKAITHLVDILTDQKILSRDEGLDAIGLRVVAPSVYFQKDRLINEESLAKLKALESRAPIHIKATLDELEHLDKIFPQVSIIGVSDSSYHASKPEEAEYYGLPLDDANHFEVKRYGYHGLSVASASRVLKSQNLLSEKVIICHLGSGSSVTALKNGRSIDNSMGYSPLEGLVMATRSGSLDFVAAEVLKDELNLDRVEFENYLSKKSGLLGLSGFTPDIRELLEDENQNKRAALALNTYVYNVQKTIGQMAASLQGCDALVFTGTIGERSGPIRQRIVSGLSYLGFYINENSNAAVADKNIATESGKPILVLPSDEEREIAEMVERAI